MGFLGWGPSWQYLGFRGSITESGTTSRLRSSATVRASGAEVAFDVAASQQGPRTLRMDIDLRADKDTDLTYVIASLEIPQDIFQGGELQVLDEAGESRSVDLPLGRQPLGNRVARLALVDATDQLKLIDASAS